VFQNLIELFKTPAISAVIAAITAILSAPLIQRLNRKATEIQWLRERRGQAYSELLISMDFLGNVLLRVSAKPTAENNQDFKSASEQFLRARSMIDLYAPKKVSVLLGQADVVHILNAGTGDSNASVRALAAIRAQIVECARDQLGNTT
jgi:hypothetical protein